MNSEVSIGRLDTGEQRFKLRTGPLALSSKNITDGQFCLLTCSGSKSPLFDPNSLAIPRSLVGRGGLAVERLHLSR